MEARPRVTAGETAVLFLIMLLLSPLLLPLREAVRVAADREAEVAAQQTCLTNLNALGRAFYQYALDYDERYPAHDVYGSDVPLNWHVTLRPYHKSDELLQCPSRQDAAEFSYGYNYFYLDRFRRLRVKLPSSTVLLVDAGRNDDGGVVSRYYHVNPPSQSTYDNVVRPDWRYNQRFASVVYCDGHAKINAPNDDVMGTYGTFYPTTVSAGGTWTGDPQHQPRRGAAPRVDAWWDTGRTWPGGP